MNIEHDLGNGWTAKKSGRTFEVYFQGEFKFSTARLKFAKAHAKAHTPTLPRLPS